MRFQKGQSGNPAGSSTRLAQSRQRGSCTACWRTRRRNLARKTIPVQALAAHGFDEGLVAVEQMPVGKPKRGRALTLFFHTLPKVEKSL